MKKQNEWEELAGQATIIQDAKNKVINGNLLIAVKEASGNNKNVNIFDYGCGWGEWADILKKNGYKNIEAYDEADEMVDQAIAKFGDSVKFYHREIFKSNIREYSKKYDIVTSNLVLCILDKAKQVEMLECIKTILKDDGTMVISFCHPCFDYHKESVVSVRKAPEGAKYDDEFEYEKQIKENGIAFHDMHRSLSYYSKLFKENSLSILEIIESDVLESQFYPDFITFILKKKS